MTPVLADLVEEGLSAWWAPGLAFAAGVVSFASPCVFPLVPGYLSFVAGSDAAPADGPAERKPVIPLLLFTAGFGAGFTAFVAVLATGLVTPSRPLMGHPLAVGGIRRRPAIIGRAASGDDRKVRSSSA